MPVLSVLRGPGDWTHSVKRKWVKPREEPMEIFNLSHTRKFCAKINVLRVIIQNSGNIWTAREKIPPSACWVIVQIYFVVKVVSSSEFIL